MKKIIGLKVKNLREQQKISQEDLAFNLEISQSYLSKIENGFIEKIDFILIQKIILFFQIDLQYFLKEKNNDSIKENTSYENILVRIKKNQEQINKLVELQNNLIFQLINQSV
ncbi:helix-turn-helix domain-containing protein [Chryseobacterium indoltheticum]|uniref:Predicted transcriptional regulator n=1 Tax=Chryseobacterium indoltheticum TaxID=254 RepID=A0A381FGR0_9FLAO|nr:helix-turn-helix transcriptional regulator [Chryseobacterium indoltheticum]QQQ29783.1 helix-turn-helix transcriptional regulator [Chryseobacterium indoltheticum]SUX45714.1 Predicted transcriptional regulator [Chryseobacterium indoltheticum]